MSDRVILQLFLTFESFGTFRTNYYSINKTIIKTIQQYIVYLGA